MPFLTVVKRELCAAFKEHGKGAFGQNSAPALQSFLDRGRALEKSEDYAGAEKVYV